MKKLFFIFLKIVVITTNLKAQEDEVPEIKGPFTSLGFGSYFANKNTAIVYDGVSKYSLIGIAYYFRTEPFRTQFEEYFKYPFEIVELPENIKYRPAREVSWQVGYRFEDGSAIYAEANFAQLNIQDAFVVAIDDPNRKSPEKLLQQIPIFGKEQRLNMNMGFHIPFIHERGFTAYIPMFGNINSTKLESNYFVINNQQYQIMHNMQGITNIRIGGMGYGGGSGIGVKMKFNKSFSLDIGYNLIYSRIRMTDELRPFGLHHSILAKIVWG
jgi:hypothetical protein